MMIMMVKMMMMIIIRVDYGDNNHYFYDMIQCIIILYTIPKSIKSKLCFR